MGLDSIFQHTARAGLVAGLILAVALGGCTPPAGTAAPGAAAASPGSGAVLNVADAAIAGNDPDMALKVSQSVLATDPHNLDALDHEAAAYYAVGRCEDAIAAYKVALTIDPKSSEAETGIGRCLIKRNALEAEQAFEAAVADDPGNAAALNDLGIARDLQGNYAGATQPYEQSLLIDPGVTATEVNLGFSLALSGDSDDALQYLGPLATSQDATPRIRQDYALALVAAGRTDEARQVLAVDLPPDQVDALIQDFSAVLASAPVAVAAPSPPASVAPAPQAVAPVAPVAPVTASGLAGPAMLAPVAPPAAIAPMTVTPVAPAEDAAGDEILR
jgi:Flp pilus assembly protein TadD